MVPRSFMVLSALTLLLSPSARCLGRGSLKDQKAGGSFASGGSRIYYTAEGAGKPLILLSGGPGFEPSYLKEVEDKLAATRRCVLLEQRGTGRSQIKLTPDAFTVDQYVADVEALRQTLKLEKLDLFGHSWGGMLAMAYAAAHPTHVGTLILCDSGGPTTDFVQTSIDNESMRMNAEDWAEVKKWSSPEESKKNPQMAADSMLRAFAPGFFYDRSKAIAFREQMAKAPKVVNVGVQELVTRPEAMKKYNLLPGLRRLHCRALVIMGKQDPMDESTGYLIRDSIPGAKLVLLDRCGHFPWIEAPQEFWRDVRSFLASR
jgi:proline iminopeptidase